MSPRFKQEPPGVSDVVISFPTEHILLARLNRPKQLNAIRRDMHPELARLWDWYDAEPSLRCAVITGTDRAFCAGADLKEWNDKNAQGVKNAAERDASWTSSGFGGLSNRRGKKPVIAAVNGLCLGGAMEMILNVDMVIASDAAKFGLPEVKRGVVAIAGALPRIIRSVGRQRASEMALLGRLYSTKEMLAWGLVNHAVKPADVLDEALQWASEVAANSPDSIIVSRAGLLGGWDAQDPVTSTNAIENGIYKGLDGGENMKEGVVSFVEKRAPRWKDSKL